MMNKKGISIGRIILYCLFLTFLGLLIYSIVLGVKNLKEKTPESQHSYMKYAYNNSFDYSGADYIISSYVTFMRNTDFVSAYNNNNFNYDLFSSMILPSYSQGYQSYVSQGIAFGQVSPLGSFVDNALKIYPSTSQGSFYRNPVNPYISDNVIDLQPLLTEAINYDNNNSSVVGIYNSQGSINNSFYYRHMNNSYSMFLWFDCDIPIDYFNFLLNGYLNATPILFYVDDYTNAIQTAVGSQWNFYKHNLSSSTIQNATRIKKFGFGVLQSASSSGSSSYL